MYPSTAFKLATYSVILLYTILGVQALGINCQGDYFKCRNAYPEAPKKLNEIIQNIPDNAWYDNKQQIACIGEDWKGAQPGAVCAYLENTLGASGVTIKKLAPFIEKHKCKGCGSVPYYFPQGDNNVMNGQLVFNYLEKPCMQWGICKA